MISKKELLEITGISYGQLYRWKREGLIPEEWFIKKSSYTGQETFFSKDKIIDRINSILELKDKYSLDELAKLLSPDSMGDITINMETVDKIDGLDIEVLKDYQTITNTQEMKFFDFVIVLALTKIKISLSKDKKAFNIFMKENANRLKEAGNTQFMVLVFDIKNNYYMMLLRESLYMEMKNDKLEICFDSGMKMVCEISLSKLNDEFRKKNKKLFMRG